MLNQKKNIAGTVTAMIGILILLAAVIIVENLGRWVKPLPKIWMPTSQLFTVLKKGAVYALVAVSMNLLNGFTGLFSLGQAGFMLLGAYAYAIFMVPVASKDQVYYLYGGSDLKFSLVDVFRGFMGTGTASLICAVLAGLILAGLVAALFAALIGLPVLRLKSDYLAIATLGFAEILRAIFQWQKLGRITNGANMIKSFPTFSDFNVRNASGAVTFRLSTLVPFVVMVLCITIIVLLIKSSYGRAFKAIRDDEVAAEAMGINLFKHKMLSFITSSFFAGVGGALFAMYTSNAQAKVFTSAMTYEILLIVVIGGIGSVSGSVIGTFLYVACSEWWLRFLDMPMIMTPEKKLSFNIWFAVIVCAIVLLVLWRQSKKGKKLYEIHKVKQGQTERKRITINWGLAFLVAVGLALIAWDISFATGASMKMPLLRSGFRMVAFSVIIMIIVLFFSRGIMGDKELSFKGIGGGIMKLYKETKALCLKCKNLGKKKAAEAAGEEDAE